MQQPKSRKRKQPVNNTELITSGETSVRKFGLSSAALKIIALVSMTCDHVSYIMSRFGLTAQGPLIAGIPILRIIGRLAFPLYAFMMAQGAKYTRDINKYLKRLFIFALISEIPFDIAAKLSSPLEIIEFTYQNVYFTLLLGLAAIKVHKILEEKGKAPLSVLTAAGLAAIAYFMKTDYSWSGVVCIYIMYLVQDTDIRIKIPAMAAAILPTVFSMMNFNKSQLFAFFALIPILLYNGKPGRRMNRTFFYAYYPAHLLIIYVILYIAVFIIR